MRKCNLIYLLLWSCMLLLVACGKNEWNESDFEKEGNASLTLTFESAEIGLATRGVEDLNDDGIVSETEMYVDGRRMYRLGVFLANSEGEIVASTVLEQNDKRFTNDNQEAIVHFGGLECNETYQYYAIANYGNYNGLMGNINITEDDDVIVDAPDVSTASTDNLCDKNVAYPLSLKGEKTLNPGLNTISGKLARTYARLRIGVSNGTSKKLTVVNLDFPDNFVQSKADLFTEGGTADAKPIVTSSHAITPFQTNTVVPKEETKNIFDAYLLESNGGTYNYTLELMLSEDAEYEIKGNKEEIRDRNNVNGNGKGPYYVIRNILSGKYLYANAATNRVELGDSYGGDEAIDANYVWKLTKIADRGDVFDFYIESMGVSGHYLKAGSSQESLALTTNDDYILIDTHADRLIFNKGNYYIAVNDNTIYWYSGKLTDNQTIQQFMLYEVSAQQQGGGSSITHTETIPIKIGDENLTAIKRNDFVNITVNVDYNDGSKAASRASGVGVRAETEIVKR